MSTDSSSKLGVTRLQKQKRMKTKHKSKDFTNETSNNIDTSVINDNNDLNDNHNKIIKCRDEKNNIKKVKNKKSKEELDDDVILPKKRSNIMPTSNILQETEDTKETDKTGSKTSKQPSKRQMKKEKAEMRKNEERMATKMEAMKKGLNYVSKWKYARPEWKFEKLKQIWLMDNLLDQASIPDDIFPTVLEYFEGCKGMAREQLLKKGMDVIRKVEESEENKDEIESVAYQRARKLLQALPTET